MKKLYWAYGSNLCEANMAVRCPKARKIRRLTVKDAALVFRGVADVTRREGSCVPGGLWEITPECEAALDRYEGVASGFYRKRYLKVRHGGKVRDVLFYQMTISKGVMPPSEYYLGVIAQGYADFGLPLEALDEAVAESWSTKKVTPRLRRRHDRKGRPALARMVA